MELDRKGLTAYFILVTLICFAFIFLAKKLGQTVNYVAGFYMLTPALSAVIVRALFYKYGFRDACFRIGNLKNYLYFWLMGVGIVILYYFIFLLFNAIKLDFSGGGYLAQMDKIMPGGGAKMIESLPAGMTLKSMLLLFTVGGVTIFNIPGIILGFGEEFGWRGFMFPQMYRIRPWIAFIIGGIIWFAWHIPLSLLSPSIDIIPLWLTIIRYLFLAVGSICTSALFAYCFFKTKSIFVPSLLHITINNSSRSFSYWVVIENQVLADVLLSITMLLIIAILYFTGEMKVFKTHPEG